MSAGSFVFVRLVFCQFSIFKSSSNEEEEKKCLLK